MAAVKNKNNHQSDIESVVNRWVADYYMHHAMELFQQEQYEDFQGIRDVLDGVLERPMEATNAMPTKIRVVQFLCRINEGEKLDMHFEADQSTTPLESALILLEHFSQELNVPQQDFEKAYISLTDMIVTILIRNGEFDKATDVLNKHFPKPVVGKKAIFMELIRQKRTKHEVIDQMDFQHFKGEMSAFCLKLCPFTVPFLHKAAEQLINKRLVEQDDEAPGCDDREEPGPSAFLREHAGHVIPSKHTIIQRSRLEMVYKALAAGSKKKAFAQLEEEVEREEQARKAAPLPPAAKDTHGDSEQSGRFQRDSGSPLEASPADQPPQTHAVPQTQASSLSKRPGVLRNRPSYSVARLVTEADSQRSSQDSTASHTLLTTEPPQSEAGPGEEDPPNPGVGSEVTRPTQKCPRQTRKSRSRAFDSTAESSAGSDDPPGSVASRGAGPTRPSAALRRSRTESKQSDDDDNRQSKDAGYTGDICISDSSLDGSPELFPLHTAPQTSSTPHKDSAQDKDPLKSKWKQLYKNAKESKETWSDEESYFSTRKERSERSQSESTISGSGHRKRMWTERETKKLKEGVEKFGEGNWNKILAYCSFKDRTNVNLKDRWRTMKKLKMV